jgi:TRAP-type C4-dicarboxylate transport system substrate-binding protein
MPNWHQMKGREMKDRVSFGSKALLLVALTIIAGYYYPAAAQDKTFTMKLSTATLNDVQHEWMKRYALAIEKNSNGRIKTEVYPASQLGSIPRQIEGTQLGSIQVWVGPPEFLVGVDPKFELLSVPGLIPSEDVAVKTMRDPEFSKEFTNSGAKKGLIGLTLNYTGPIVFAMRSPVRTLADFKGKKIRILASPFQTEQMTKLGSTGVAMSLGDVLPAIQQGTIDGAMSSAGVFRALQYYDAAKYLTETDHAYVFSISVVSKRWLDTLPADLQEVVLKTAKETSDEVLPWSLEFVAAQRKLWTDKGGEVIRLSPEDYSQLMKITAPIGPEVVKTRSDTKPLWDLLNAAVKRAQ